MLRFAIIGCGDVVARRYLTTLRRMAGLVEIVACCDIDRGQAERVAAMCSPTWNARAFTEVDALLEGGEIDAILNLTPPGAHYDVSLSALSADVHVYSEKPLARTLAEADELIEHAQRVERLLLCAPALMVTPRAQLMKRIIESGQLGGAIAINGQIANLGPAAWPPYTGDPAPYYQPGIGPLRDEGVYLIHLATGLMGPATRVQAFGGIAVPQRTSRVNGRIGQAIKVEANDHMLVHLDFGDGRFGQLLSSFAVPATLAPTFEVYCEQGTIAMNDHLRAAGSIDVFVSGGPLSPVEGWVRELHPGADASGHELDDVVGAGVAHFIACLRGDQQPILSAEHARHALEVFVGAERSARDGGPVSIATTFPVDGTSAAGRSPVVLTTGQ